MKNHLFSILVLLSISTHIFAMEETALTLFKEDTMDWSEWLVEHKTHLAAGSLVIGSGAWSLCKGDKRPFLLGCTAVGCCAAYIYLNHQNDDETTQRINALKAQYGTMRSDLLNIKDQMNDIQTVVAEITEFVDDLNAISSNIGQSKTIMTQVANNAHEMKQIAAELVCQSKELHNDTPKITDGLNKTEDITKSTQKIIRSDDTSHWNKIFNMLAMLNTIPDSSSKAG